MRARPIALEFIVAKRPLPWFERKLASEILGAPVIISLTSYPPRFGTLALTLRCLLSQNIKPDSVVLWIAEKDVEFLPYEVTRLIKKGLQIRTCVDLKSYKKIIPALVAFPNAFIVTADDDLYYDKRWLSTLVRSYDPNANEIVCHRCHRIGIGSTGADFIPYECWTFEIQESGASPLYFPTSGAGALYPPGTFPSDATDQTIFTDICPTADDVWLYWMASLGGKQFRKVGRKIELYAWKNSQAVGLWANVNATGGNDIQINNMISKYGIPAGMRAAMLQVSVSKTE